LLFGATHYDGAVDIWSAGCVIAEMLLGQPLFNGENNADQMLSIIQVLGSPSHAEMMAMNPQCELFDFPRLPPLPWRSAFRASADPLAIDLVSKLCVFTPSARLNGYPSLLHPFFDELRAPQAALPNGNKLPPLFEFTPDEVAFIGKDLLSQLVPPHMQMDPWFVERMDALNVGQADEE
jgi:serine/threonine protein kinase